MAKTKKRLTKRTKGVPTKKRQSTSQTRGFVRDCCALFQSFLDAPSGTLMTIEDGVPVLIEPPTQASYLRIDPGQGTGMPHWEPE